MPTYVVTVGGENVRPRRIRVKNVPSEAAAEQRAVHAVQRKVRDASPEIRAGYRRAKALRIVKESD